MIDIKWSDIKWWGKIDSGEDYWVMCERQMAWPKWFKITLAVIDFPIIIATIGLPMLYGLIWCNLGKEN